jgi:hypothetical protein
VGAEDVSSDRIVSVRVRPVAIANALARAVAPGGIIRRAFCLGSFLLAFFCLASVIAHGKGVHIVTKTDLHSANYIWSPGEENTSEYDEFDDVIVQVKGCFPQDRARTSIGVGELINLRVKGDPVDLGDTEWAEWVIISGSEWAEFTHGLGEVVALGAKPIDGPLSRTVEIEVTTTTLKSARVTITIFKPTGVLKSRHVGTATENPVGANTSQYSDMFTPASQEPEKVPVPATGIGAWTRIFVIPMPSTVNFGGDYEDGVFLKEKDVGSPPTIGTYTPSEESIFSQAKHEPNANPAKINSNSSVVDRIWFYSNSLPLFSTKHTCTWTCGFSWNGIEMPPVLQTFEISTETNPMLGDYGLVKKFNSSVIRGVGFGGTWAFQYRDKENDWKP